MTLIVEDGTGVENADSYAEIIDADAYWAGANTDWNNAPDGTKQLALRRASEFLDITYMNALPPLNEDQGLAFPPSPEPTARQLATVRRATIMVAAEALTGPLVGQSDAEGRVIASTDKVGDLSESRQYADRSGPTTVNGKDFSFLDAMLSPFSNGGGSSIAVGRVSRG
jgi:hypothetical protein